MNVKVEEKTGYFSKATNKLTENITKALTKAALLVEADAKIHCPVDTGLLRNSITHTINGNEAEVGTNMEYAPYVEFGTGLFNVDGIKELISLYLLIITIKVNRYGTN